jgi:phage baseplate assembly protein W
MSNDIRKFYSEISGKSDQIYDYVSTVSEVGDFKKVNGIQVLIHSIRNLLLTPLGFYPFDPNYGSLLYKKVFEPLDDQSIEEIKYEVNQRIKEFDDRVKITSVDVQILGNDQKGIQVNVNIKKGSLTGTASLTFSGSDKKNQLNFLQER